MIRFQPGQTLKASSLNDNFNELSMGSFVPGGGSRGQFGSSGFMPQKGEEQLGQDQIWVQNNYPFRLPRFAAVGIDQPILGQSPDDVASLDRFLSQPTIYSCTKNQARHRNRIGILQQALQPGEIGKASISAATKAVFYFEQPPNIAENVNQPAVTIESTGDDYRHLGIASALWNSKVGVGGDGTEADYTPASDGWGVRDRPHWLFPIPRNTEASDNNSELPFDSLRSATSHGRVSALSGHAVPVIGCSGVSSLKCLNQRWQVMTSTCSPVCSSWPIIEDIASAAAYGLTLPCDENDVVDDVACVPELPSVAVDSGSVDSGYFAAWGNWQSSYAHETTDDERFLVGDVMLSNPRENADKLGAGTRNIGSEQDNAQDCIDIDTAQKANRCCANVTCTYQCDGDEFVLVRGATPYVIHSGMQCICPDSIIADRAGFELPCGDNTQPREFTIGMIYSTTTTTTATTTTNTSTTTSGTTTTTTAPCVNECSITWTIDAGNPAASPVQVTTDDCGTSQTGTGDCGCRLTELQALMAACLGQCVWHAELSPPGYVCNNNIGSTNPECGPSGISYDSSHIYLTLMQVSAGCGQDPPPPPTTTTTSSTSTSTSGTTTTTTSSTSTTSTTTTDTSSTTTGSTSTSTSGTTTTTTSSTTTTTTATSTTTTGSTSTTTAETSTSGTTTTTSGIGGSTGACCLGGSQPNCVCSENVTAADCTNSMGAYLGNGSTCGVNNANCNGVNCF